MKEQDKSNIASMREGLALWEKQLLNPQPPKGAMTSVKQFMTESAPAQDEPAEGKPPQPPQPA